MYGLFFGLLMLVMEMAMFTVSKLLERQNINMIINKKVHISNSYEIKFMIPENPKTTLFLIKENEMIDNDIKTCTRKLLKWYLVGTNRYFVISRITGKIDMFDDYHSMSKRSQKIFNELLSRPEDKKL